MIHFFKIKKCISNQPQWTFWFVLFNYTSFTNPVSIWFVLFPPFSLPVVQNFFWLVLAWRLYSLQTVNSVQCIAEAGNINFWGLRHILKHTATSFYNRRDLKLFSHWVALCRDRKPQRITSNCKLQNIHSLCSQITTT